MANQERLNTTLQQNLLTLLCYDDDKGKLIASILDPALFEGDLRVVAERAVEFWKLHKEAPKHHTPDLVGDILDDPNNRKAKTFERILTSMLELADNVNSNYVLDQLRKFTRLQTLKDAILRSAETLNTNQETAIDEVEAMWSTLVHARQIAFEPGLRLDSVDQVLTFLSTQYEEFRTGIKELDQRHVVPARGTAMLLLGPTGLGKTWFLVNIGKQALLQRKKVLHVSLEMGEEEVLQRYYQALFSATKRDHDVETTTLEFDGEEGDKNRKLEAIGTETVHPDFTFDSEMVAMELEAHLFTFGSKSRNLMVKRFASLNMAQLESYLDALETVEGFIPDLLIFDYIGLVKTNSKEKRLDLGEEFKSYRSICIRRNMAGVTAQQSSKIGAQAKTVTMFDVAEDWSLTNTADMVLTYSSTDSEHRLGLGRLYVSKARGEGDKFGVLLTQNYNMGQFVLASHYLGKDYWTISGDFEDEEKKKKKDDEDEE